MAIDRCSRFVHLAVYDAENAAEAVAFLGEARKAVLFRITHVLTDRGSCFTADDFDPACAKIKVSHRTTRPYTPQTNGMVERFNGRVAREVLGINVDSHADLETLLVGFNYGYNRRQWISQIPAKRWKERLQLNRQLDLNRILEVEQLVELGDRRLVAAERFYRSLRITKNPPEGRA